MNTTKTRRRLTPREVEAIRALTQHGFTLDSVATLYGVCLGTAQKILHRQTHRAIALQPPLPVIDPAVAPLLRVRHLQILKADNTIADYARRLAEQVAPENREYVATALLEFWKPKRMRQPSATNSTLAGDSTATEVSNVSESSDATG